MTSAYKMHTRDSIRRRLGTMDTQIGNSYSTMKLAILNSLFSQLHCNPLHLMFVTEEVSFIQRSVRL